MADSTLRQRNVASKDTKAPQKAGDTPKKSSGISGLDIVRILFALVLLSAGASWVVTGESFIWNWRKLATLAGQAQRYMKGPIHLTDTELSKYNGENSSLPIYVGLNGTIYDVSASRSTYGPGGSYSFFSGRDATRAFLTGCFQEDLTPDLRGVEEMYLPLEKADEVPVPSKAELKIRRERDMRQAKKQIKGTIDHWAEVFSGVTGRPYFKVGEIVREEGWLEKLEKRELCQQAKDGRPSRKDYEANLKAQAKQAKGKGKGKGRP